MMRYMALLVDAVVSLSIVVGDLPEGALELSLDAYSDAMEAQQNGAELSIEDGELIVPQALWYAFTDTTYPEHPLVGFRQGYSVPDGAIEITNEQRLAALAVVGTQVSIENNALVISDLPAPSPSQLRDIKRDAINDAYENAMRVIKSRYPQSEIDGWPEQVAALAEYDADPEAPNIIIDGLALANVTSRSEMAERIRTKRTGFRVVYTTLTGLRQSLENALNAIDLDAPGAADAIAAIDESQLLDAAQQFEGAT